MGVTLNFKQRFSWCSIRIYFEMSFAIKLNQMSEVIHACVLVLLHASQWTEGSPLRQTEVQHLFQIKKERKRKKETAYYLRIAVKFPIHCVRSGFSFCHEQQIF